MEKVKEKIIRFYGIVMGYINPREQENPNLQHLSQSVILEESVNPQIVRYTMIAISMIILFFLLWAYITPIKEVAKTQGVVTTIGYARKIQNLENGLISKIHVADGDLVEAGTTLIELNSTGAQEDLKELTTHQTSLALQAERLRAYINNKKPDFSSIKTASAKMIAEQERMLAGMLTSHKSNAKILTDQIAQRRDSLNIIENKKKTLTKNYELAKKIDVIKKKTFKQGLISKLELLESEREMNRMKGELDSLESEIKQATQAITEYESRYNSLDAKLKESALQQLGEVQDETVRNEETLVKYQRRVDRLMIKSPIRGLVKGLNVHTQGGVITPGQTIMEIVPLDEDLVIDTLITPFDIGHVELGQEVNIKVDAFDSVRYGSIKGTLDSISATTFIDENGNSFYKGRITPKSHYVNDDKRKILLPGMTVEADVITGEKTILQYLLKPIKRSFGSALSER